MDPWFLPGVIFLSPIAQILVTLDAQHFVGRLRRLLMAGSEAILNGC
jgi:hypothetical protein